jgi:hypothetical protein
MPLGPGKYDDLCTLVREKSRAQGVILIVVGGDRGEGFSVQATAGVVRVLPDLLDSVSQQLRETQDHVRDTLEYVMNLKGGSK